MNQIYQFDRIAPPKLTEKILLAQMERRKTRRQVLLFALAGALTEWCVIAVGVMLYPLNVYLSACCFAYACIAILGGTVIAAVFSKQRRNIPCSSASQ